MPAIRPLETLHNALSLRQLDAFLERVTAAPVLLGTPPAPPAPLPHKQPSPTNSECPSVAPPANSKCPAGRPPRRSTDAMVRRCGLERSVVADVVVRRAAERSVVCGPFLAQL